MVSDQIDEIRVLGNKTPNKTTGVNLTEVLWMPLSPFSFLFIHPSSSSRATNWASLPTSAHCVQPSLMIYWIELDWIGLG